MVKGPRRRSNSRHVLLGLAIFFLIVSLGGMGSIEAAEGVIYKKPSPMKKLFQDQEEESAATLTGEGKKKEYFYDPRGKTDPFESFIAKMEAIQEKRKGKPKTYLETLDLSQLELIAIIVGPKGNWAMVREAKGTGHVIRVGTPIGTKGGVVHKITEKEVIIREEYRDFRGQKRERFVSKKVPSLK